MAEIDHLEQLRLEINQAVGDCIACWSHIELDLAQLFRIMVGANPVLLDAKAGLVMGDAIWSSVASFEAKMLMLLNVLRIALENKSEWDDFLLLHAYVRQMGKERNKIAHATLLNFNNKEMVLEPFFVMTQPKEYVRTPEIRAITEKFRELHMTLNIFFSSVTSTPEQRIKYSIPATDLLLRLRSEDARTREEQRRRQQSSRQ